MSADSAGMSEGDRRAWKHGLANMHMLTDEELHNLALLAIYTRQVIELSEDGLTEAELEVVRAWATDARINVGLLDAALAGGVFIHVRDGTVSFALTPKGEREAIALAEKLGLPTPGPSKERGV